MSSPPSTCPVCRASVPVGATVCDVCGLVFASTGAAQVLTPLPSTPATPPLVPGQVLDRGNYVVDRPLSKGGMGALYLAHDKRAFDRPVVIKTMLDYFDTSDPREVQLARERFIEEARTLSRVKHPNFPQIFAHFLDGSQTCIVMEYIEGRDLGLSLSRINERTGQRIKGKAFPKEKVIGWGIDVCRMLEHLATHQPPIIHHDIKPNNLVLDDHSGEIFLVDFGTAKAHLLTGKATTGSNAFGTPGYAPPEQYRGQSEPRSDVYALAATLYHLASDDDPADHPFKFPKLGQLGQLGKALEPALERDPANRPTAAELRAALKALLEPAVVAAKLTKPAPTAKPARRPPVAPAPVAAAPAPTPPVAVTSTSATTNPALINGAILIGVFGALVVTLIVIVGLTTGSAREEEREVATAVLPATEAPIPTATPRRNPTAQSATANAIPTSGSGAGGAAPDISIPTAGPELPVPPGAVWRSKGTEWEINDLAFDQSGSVLISGGDLGFLELWDSAEGGPVLTLRGDLDDITALTFSPENKPVLGGSEGLIQIWPLDTSDYELFEATTGPITHLATSNLGALAVANSSGEILLYNLRDAERQRRVLWRTSCKTNVGSVGFDPEGTRIGIVDSSGCIEIWDVLTSTRLVFERNSVVTRLSDLSFTGDGTLLVAQVNTSLSLSRVKDGQTQTEVITDFTSTITTLTLSSDGQYLAVGYNDGTIEVFTTSAPSAFARFQLPEGLPATLAFAPDSSILASGDDQGFVTVWKLP
jgi:tRNA A-37 threonylcarbamoyl transferase component Bud32